MTTKTRNPSRSVVVAPKDSRIALEDNPGRPTQGNRLQVSAVRATNNLGHPFASTLGEMNQTAIAHVMRACVVSLPRACTWHSEIGSDFLPRPYSREGEGDGSHARACVRRARVSHARGR